MLTVKLNLDMNVQARLLEYAEKLEMTTDELVEGALSQYLSELEKDVDDYKSAEKTWDDLVESAELN